MPPSGRGGLFREAARYAAIAYRHRARASVAKVRHGNNVTRDEQHKRTAHGIIKQERIEWKRPGQWKEPKDGGDNCKHSDQMNEKTTGILASVGKREAHPVMRIRSVPASSLKLIRDLKAAHLKHFEALYPEVNREKERQFVLAKWREHPSVPPQSARSERKNVDLPSVVSHNWLVLFSSGISRHPGGFGQNLTPVVYETLHK